MMNSKEIDVKVSKLVDEIMSQSAANISERIRVSLYNMFYYGYEVHLREQLDEDMLELDIMLDNMEKTHGKNS